MLSEPSGIMNCVVTHSMVDLRGMDGAVLVTCSAVFGSIGLSSDKSADVQEVRSRMPAACVQKLTPKDAVIRTLCRR
jgi:hypothetical protein